MVYDCISRAPHNNKTDEVFFFLNFCNKIFGVNVACSLRLKMKQFAERKLFYLFLVKR